MKFFFIVEDFYGARFIKEFFKKKLDEGLFSGTMIGAEYSPIGPKIARIIAGIAYRADRVIILADADDRQLETVEKEIIRFVRKEHVSDVKIVLFKHEVEEWICYSRGIKIDCKPSKILKRTISYEKNMLPEYASKIDCKKLADCQSFRRLVDAITS